MPPVRIKRYAHMRSVTCGRRLCMSKFHEGPRWLPVAYFPPAEWFEGEEFVKRIHPLCHACARLAYRERHDAKPRSQSNGLRADPLGNGYVVETEEEREIYRAYQRRRYQKSKKDPKKVEARREYQRIYAEVRRRQRGIEPRVMKKERKLKKENVDAAPFAEWIEWYTKSHLMTLRELASISRISESTLSKIKNGDRGEIGLGSVDRVLRAVDRGPDLDDLYPLEEKQIA